MSNPNIVTTSNIFGKTDVAVAGTSEVSVVSNPSSSGKVFKINTLVVANTSAASMSAEVGAMISRGTSDVYIVKALSVPLAASVVVIGRENPIYLNEGDDLVVTCGEEGGAHAICSYEEIS